MPDIQINPVIAPYALDVQGVSAGYNGKLAIEDVSFSVAKGKRVALIGPNGAGKSTLFRAIVGLLPLRTGEICIEGEQSAAAREQAAYVPQTEDVDWSFPVSVLDVVVMGLARRVGWLRLPGRQHRELARVALDRVGMADYARRQIGELSGGQKRRVFIARALAQGAHILLLDEPFTGVDHPSQHTLFGILDDLQAEGVTALVATHDLNTVARHFDELLVLNRRAIAYGTPDQVFRPEILAPAFGGQIAIWNADQQLIMLTDQCCP